MLPKLFIRMCPINLLGCLFMLLLLYFFLSSCVATYFMGGLICLQYFVFTLDILNNNNSKTQITKSLNLIYITSSTSLYVHKKLPHYDFDLMNINLYLNK